MASGGQKPLIVDSTAARREFTQCQNCYKSKDKHKVKLSLCTGCHVATYCSPACQRAHWPKHKSVCLHRREQQQQILEFDDKARHLTPATSGPTPPSPLPSEVYAELRAFTKKFNPALFQAGFNCLHLATHPATALDFVVTVILDRLPDASPADRRPWARFRLKFIGPIPAEFMAQKYDRDGKFLQIKQQQESEHLAAGYTGTVTLLISADMPGGPFLHNVSCVGFGDHSKHALKIEENWKETLEETIEKMCGRTDVKEAAGTSS